MVQDLSLASRSSSLANNRLQEFQSLIMNYDPSQKSPSLATPVPLLIVFRFFSINPASENPPRLSWLTFKGASHYIVQLRSSKGIVWREQVKATDESTVTYCGEIILEPGRDYIFTVEIVPKKSCEDYQFTQDDKISEYVKEGIKKIKQKDLPNQFKVSLISQLDSFLIARKEILDIIQGVILQGSNSEVICFLDDFIDRASAFKLLADACSSDDILDALARIANQLAAVHITLGEYLRLSGVQKSLTKSRFLNGAEIAFSTQNLQTLSRTSSLDVCDICQQQYDDYIKQGFSPVVSWYMTCAGGTECKNCPVCQN